MQSTCFLWYTDFMSAEYENSFKYFENRACQYYPCHKAEHINCLFCYCPLYSFADCPGNYTITGKGDAGIKNCTDCIFPHDAANYGSIIRILTEKNRNHEE